MRGIGQRHAAICHYIEQYTQAQGWPPSRREIGEALGFTSISQVAYYLTALEQQGYLHRQPYISRGLALTPAGHRLAEHVLAV